MSVIVSRNIKLGKILTSCQVYAVIAVGLMFDKMANSSEPRKSGPGHMLVKQPSEEGAEGLLED